MGDVHTLDLSPGDVHVPGASERFKRAPRYAQTPEKTMAEISTKKRNALPGGKFALPEDRAYPIHDAAHVRNAAARLEQAKKAGTITDAKYAKAKAAIARAAKRFGIESEYNASDDAGAKPNGRLSVRADLAHGGSLHVTHHAMSDKPLYGSTIALADETFTAAEAKLDEGVRPPPVWIQLAEPGTFRGHPAGPFELNTDVFEEIVRNFHDTKNREIPIDFEHSSEADPTSGSIPDRGAPAQGWIRDLKIQGGKLFGLVEWNPLARDYIKSRAYKYISPAIRFNSKDRVSGRPIGARLTSAGLTNQPFLDGMMPLAAKDGATAMSAPDAPPGSAFGEGSLAHSPYDYMPKVKAALSMHPLCSATECADHLDRLRDMYAADQADDRDGVHMGVHLADFMHPLRDLVGAAPGWTWEDVFDTVDSMIQEAMQIHEREDHGQGAEEAAASDKDPATETTNAAGDAPAGTTQPETTNMSTTQSTTAAAPPDPKDALIAAKDQELANVRTDHATALAAKDTEIKSLKDEIAKRDQAEQERVVGERHDTYKDKKPMSKESMLALFKADRALFDKEFPPVAANQRHLLADMTGKREPTRPIMGDGAPARQEGQPGTAKITMRDLARQVAKIRKCTLGQAMVLVDEARRAGGESGVRALLQ